MAHKIRKIIAKRKLKSLILRKEKNEVTLPFIHRKLERTFDIERSLKIKSKNLELKANFGYP